MSISHSDIIKSTIGAVLSTIIVGAGVAKWQSIQNTLATGLTIPRGGIVAFALSDGCPAGWSDFAKGHGRTIVGSGVGYQYDSTGGAETIMLTVPEMPSHGHNVVGTRDNGRQVENWGLSVNGNGNMLRLDADDGAAWNGITGKLSALPQGGGRPHENRSPYIALHLCKKN